MPYKIFVKVGRILIGLGIGTLIGITCAVLNVGSNNIDNFGIIIFLGALAIISGITIIIKTKSEIKLEELQTTDESTETKTCPQCGLTLSEECKQCPKCNTVL